MAKHPHQTVFPTSLSGGSGERVIASFKFAVDGILETAIIDSDITNSSGSPIVFDVRVNDVSIYDDPDDRPSIANGQHIVTQTGLNIEVSRFQSGKVVMITTLSPLTPIGNSLYAQLVVEDGEAVQGPPGDDGAAGTNGTVWRTGSGAPSNGTGVNGDLYFRTSNGDVYERQSGTYTVIGNIKGPTGTAGTDGSDGVDGVGVPIGGTLGQILAKASGTDYDTVWIDAPSGGGGGSWDGGLPDNTGRSNFFFFDDFLTHATSSNSAAARWNLIASLSNQHGLVDGEPNHPGIYFIKAPDSSMPAGIVLKDADQGHPPFHSSSFFDMTLILRPKQNNTNVAFLFGLVGDSYVNGAYFQKDPADNFFHGVCRASSVSSVTGAFSAYTANTFYKFRVRRVDASTIGFSINDGTEQALTTNVPAGLVYPQIWATSPITTADAQLDIDLIDIAITGMTRF